ncbi:MAG: hypothetical protein IT264_06575 [Saprospiraceae bacterium]|nr:hypothetical protein [Saprospiraceae bacterium]
MIQLKSFMSFLLIVSLTFTFCKKDEETAVENLTAEWSSTVIKIDGVVAPSTITILLHLQSTNQYEISTNISPFTHPKSGSWSVNIAGDKLTLEGNVWTIHHLDGSTMRISSEVDGREIEIDFAK